MSDTDDSLLREINEDLRREQIAKLWDRYGVVLLTGVGLLIAIVLGYQYWQRSQIATAQEYGAKYTEALQLARDGKNDEALKTLKEIANSAPKGYAVLARLKLAASLAKTGKTAEAVKAYEAIIADGGADKLLADYARLRAAGLRLGEADWTEMQNRLTPLTAKDSAWRFSASELLGLAAMQAGETARAREEFSKLLADRLTPRSIRTRVTILMGMIAQRELAAKEKSKAGAGKKTTNHKTTN